jgi:hypothetical protein
MNFPKIKSLLSFCLVLTSLIVLAVGAAPVAIAMYLVLVAIWLCLWSW